MIVRFFSMRRRNDIKNLGLEKGRALAWIPPRRINGVSTTQKDGCDI